jgi:hypothetical protein
VRHSLREAFNRVGSFFRKDQRDQELNEEMAHIWKLPWKKTCGAVCLQRKPSARPLSDFARAPRAPGVLALLIAGLPKGNVFRSPGR